MSGEREERFEELAGKVMEGDLDQNGARRLLEMCREDTALRDRFAGQVDVERLLEMALEQGTGRQFAREVIERIRRDDAEPFVSQVIGRVGRASRQRKWLRGLAMAGIAAVFALGIGWGVMANLVRASLHRDDTARWAGEAPPRNLRAGATLVLRSGLAEVHFKNGAELILEGPAELEIGGSGAGWLRRGKAVVRVPERAIGFILDSPGGRLVDLGTAFGVHVGTGGETETQVFEGKVKIRPAGGAKDLIVHENETFAVGHAGAIKSAGVTDSVFVTGLPPKADGKMPFTHWPMDEGNGTSVGALLPGLVSDALPGVLRTFREEAGLPGWIAGPFGGALSFNGDGQAVETFHQGPAGDSARTIAFWVRVPVDFDPAQGLGIISWGKLREWGTAWQVSINPYGQERGNGRLRVGTGKSGVDGVTDLRDGKWHHCAIVLYQDPLRADRFPVLLYVDGEMEAASTKAVYGVRTESGEDARPIWIGRSLGHGREDRPPQGTGFFRGDLDEIYVFEGALNRRQIEKLMLRNKAPGE